MWVGNTFISETKTLNCLIKVPGKVQKTHHKKGCSTMIELKKNKKLAWLYSEIKMHVSKVPWLFKAEVYWMNFNKRNSVNSGLHPLSLYLWFRLLYVTLWLEIHYPSNLFHIIWLEWILSILLCALSDLIHLYSQTPAYIFVQQALILSDHQSIIYTSFKF